MSLQSCHKVGIVVYHFLIKPTLNLRRPVTLVAAVFFPNCTRVVAIFLASSGYRLLLQYMYGAHQRRCESW